MTEIVTTSDERLVELAEIANREHANVDEALGSAVHHAILAGVALWEARQAFGPAGDGWPEWCAATLRFGYRAASMYVRLARHKDSLPPEAFDIHVDTRGHVTQPSATRALAYIRGLPRAGWGNRVPAAVRQEAKRLHASGVSQTEVARMLGVSQGFVSYATNPDHHKEVMRRNRAASRDRRRALALLREQESVRRAKDAAAVIGGPAADAYALIRRTAQRVDEARAAADTPEIRAHYNAALKHIYKAEDAISQALRGAAKEEAA